MKKTLFLLLIIFSSFNLFASDFCTRTQGDLKTLLYDQTSRISFRNSGGLINGGVCWWHSRLQRSSSYLVQFRPDSNRPTPPELNLILNSLRTMNKTVIIPGYSDFKTFSHDYKNEVQAMLDSWQKSDGFFNFVWVRGISGKSELEPRAMQVQMNNVYDYYKSTQTPLWVMAQIKGITSHSLLILHMVQNANGYSMKVIDSNHPSETITIYYNIGDRNLRFSGAGYSFVPYVGFQNDFLKIGATLESTCGGTSKMIDITAIKPGDLEL
jgi:hypothetical protein